MEISNVLEKLKEKWGSLLPIKLPSGESVIIREQNGEDDEVISKSKDTLDGSSITKFLKGIIVWYSKYPDVVVDSDMVWNMPLRDRVYIP